MNKTKNAFAFFVVLLCILAFSSVLVRGQDQSQGEKKSKYWTVAGYRHGPSFFPRSFYDETKPLQKGVMDFKHYHTYKEMVWWFKKWAAEYPDLVDLYMVAQSFGGRDIYQLTVTNKKTGKDTDKPAMFIDGNRHSGEVTAAESAFWMFQHKHHKRAGFHFR